MTSLRYLFLGKIVIFDSPEIFLPLTSSPPIVNFLFFFYIHRLLDKISLGECGQLPNLSFGCELEECEWLVLPSLP